MWRRVAAWTEGVLQPSSRPGPNWRACSSAMPSPLESPSRSSSLIAIFGNWGTHYDVGPPEAPQVATMAPLLKWLWIGLLPQTVWIYLTVVGGMIFGGIAAALSGRPPAASGGEYARTR